MFLSLMSSTTVAHNIYVDKLHIATNFYSENNAKTINFTQERAYDPS